MQVRCEVRTCGLGRMADPITDQPGAGFQRTTGPFGRRRDRLQACSSDRANREDAGTAGPTRTQGEPSPVRRGNGLGTTAAGRRSSPLAPAAEALARRALPDRARRLLHLAAGRAVPGRAGPVGPPHPASGAAPRARPLPSAPGARRCSGKSARPRSLALPPRSCRRTPPCWVAVRPNRRPRHSCRVFCREARPRGAACASFEVGKATPIALAR